MTVLFQLLVVALAFGSCVSLSQYNYAACPHKLSINNSYPNSSDFHYDRGYYFGDTLAVIPVDNENYVDFYSRTGDMLTYNSSIYLEDAYFQSIAMNQYFLALGGNATYGGQVFVYTLTEGGQWYLNSTVRSDNDSSKFATNYDAIALSNYTLAVGDTNHPDGGAVYIYEYSAGSWSLMSTLVNDLEHDNDGTMGMALDLEGNRLVMSLGENVFVYSCESGAWTDQSILYGGYNEHGDYSFEPTQIYSHDDLIFISQRRYQGDVQHFHVYMFFQGPDDWVEKEFAVAENDSIDVLAFSRKNDNLLLVSTSNVWEYKLGTVQNLAYCDEDIEEDEESNDEGDSGGGRSHDSVAEVDSESNDLGMIIGVIGVFALAGAMFCMWFYDRSGSRSKANGDTKEVEMKELQNVTKPTEDTAVEQKEKDWKAKVSGVLSGARFSVVFSFIKLLICIILVFRVNNFYLNCGKPADEVGETCKVQDPMDADFPFCDFGCTDSASYRWSDKANNSCGLVASAACSCDSWIFSQGTLIIFNVMHFVLQFLIFFSGMKDLDPQKKQVDAACSYDWRVWRDSVSVWSCFATILEIAVIIFSWLGQSGALECSSSLTKNANGDAEGQLKIINTIVELYKAPASLATLYFNDKNYPMMVVSLFRVDTILSYACLMVINGFAFLYYLPLTLISPLLFIYRRWHRVGVEPVKASDELEA